MNKKILQLANTLALLTSCFHFTYDIFYPENVTILLLKGIIVAYNIIKRAEMFFSHSKNIFCHLRNFRHLRNYLKYFSSMK